MDCLRRHPHPHRWWCKITIPLEQVAYELLGLPWFKPELDDVFDPIVRYIYPLFSSLKNSWYSRFVWTERKFCLPLSMHDPCMIKQATGEGDEDNCTLKCFWHCHDYNKWTKKDNRTISRQNIPRSVHPRGYKLLKGMWFFRNGLYSMSVKYDSTTEYY